MDKMRILLINPPVMLWMEDQPAIAPPLGLAYIAAVLESKYDVQILDCILEGSTYKKPISEEINQWGMDPDQIKGRLAQWEPKVVGISLIYSSQDEVVMSVAAAIKEYARFEGKEITVVLGGPHASAGPKQLMRNRDIDFIVMGEGELPMLQLCQAIESGTDYSHIGGLVYRDSKGAIKSNDKKQFVNDIDKLPPPARHLLAMDQYSQMDTYFAPMAKPCTSVMLTRGCSNKCIFCSVPSNFGDTCRVRSPKIVLQEIKLLVERYGIKEFFFEDDNLLWNLDYMEEFCYGLINSQMGVIWSCPAGIVARGYKRRLLEGMKKSGCYSVTVNAESGSDRVLGDIIDSPNDRDIFFNLARDLKKNGIQVRGNFRVGWPFENRNEIAETYNFIQELDLAEFNVYTAVPFPGTAFWDRCIKENLFAKPFKFREYLTNEFFINSTNFTVDGLAVLMEDLDKKSKPETGGFLGKMVSSFGPKEKKKKRKTGSVAQ